MKLIDITKELFSTPVYPGDPEARLHFVRQLKTGGDCNLSELSAGSHNGTHMDAPLHFIPDGADISQVALERCLGPCVVVREEGILSLQRMQEILRQAGSPERLLLAGKVFLSREAAVAAVTGGVKLVGTQQSSIAPMSDPAGPHCALLSASVAVLENLDLETVQPGKYWLCALPLKNRGEEASMVRAVLIQK
ncbi:MAG: cyclase family protein [Oscillospiraceae bacterium]|jgi:arylformamidase|nr:cyclase family protein [Oscillospiraceae bacterium]MDD3262134.1 cyclase family protein [Oscillospiraceae bacterium]